MALQRLILVVMSLAVFCYVMPEAWADGDRGTPAEARDYAQREAGSSAAEEFVGGNAHPLIIIVGFVMIGFAVFAITIIVTIITVVWNIIDPPSAPASELPATP